MGCHPVINYIYQNLGYQGKFWLREIKLCSSYTWEFKLFKLTKLKWLKSGVKSMGNDAYSKLVGELALSEFKLQGFTVYQVLTKFYLI